MNEDQLPEDKPENKAEEQRPGYGMKLTIAHSFEEMNELDAKDAARFTGIEHLQHVTEYIMHLYSDELKNKMTDLTIKFRTNGDRSS